MNLNILHCLMRIRPLTGLAGYSLQLTIVKLVTICAGLVVTRMLSQYLSLEEYGTYSQILLINSVFTSFAILGLSDATNFFFNRQADREVTQGYIYSIFALQYFVGTLCAFVVYCLRGALAEYFGNPLLGGFCRLVAFMPLLANLLPMYQNLFISIGKTQVIIWRNLLVALVRVGAITSICLIGYKIETILVFLLILDFLQVLYFSCLFKKFAWHINIFKAQRKYFWPILKYSLPMACFILLNALSRDLDRLFIGYYCSTADLAIYTNAAKILPFDLLTSSLIIVIIPVLTRFVARNNTKDALALLRVYLRISLLVTWSVALGAIVMAPELICMLYGKKYLPGLSIFILYIGVDILRFANTSLVFSVQGKSHVLLFYGLGALAANFACNFVFFHLWGMLGPAIATVLTTGVMGVLMLRHSAHLLHGTLSQMLDYKEILWMVAGFAAAGGLTYFFRKFLLIWNLPGGITLGLGYGVFLIIIGTALRQKVLVAWREINRFQE